MDESRYQIVDSLYGPGTVGCWLLTLCSVLLSWTLNRRLAKDDTITYDFIATLTLPSIASAHLAYLLVRLPAPPTEVVTSQDPDLIQHAAAIEAPVNICETFSAAALLLFAIAAWRSQRKRVTLVFIVGILSWVMETVMFVRIGGLPARLSNLSRPFLFNWTALMGFGWSIPVGSAVIMASSVVIRRLLRRNSTTGTQPADLQVTQVDPEPNLQIRGRPQDSGPVPPGERTLSAEAQLHALSVESMRDTAVIKLITLLTLPTLLSPVPFSMGSSIFVGTGLLGETQGSVTRDSLAKLLFFMPKTNASLSNLDQAVALAGGAIAVIFSVADALTTSSARRATQEQEYEMTRLNRSDSRAQRTQD